MMVAETFFASVLLGAIYQSCGRILLKRTISKPQIILASSVAMAALFLVNVGLVSALGVFLGSMCYYPNPKGSPKPNDRRRPA